jgi:hypothetical protein
LQDLAVCDLAPERTFGMARKSESRSKGTGRLQKVAGAVKRVFTPGREEEAPVMHATPSTAEPRARKESPSTARPARREADIPLDMLDRAYTPPVTSSKTSFRSDGSDHEQDQELTPGNASERWNDEDHYTNKSGDPRIGTRGRTYEPGEALAESRK